MNSFILIIPFLIIPAFTQVSGELNVVEYGSSAAITHVITAEPEGQLRIAFSAYENYGIATANK